MTLRVFVDRLSSFSAHLTVWLDESASPDASAGRRITGGQLVGPFCQLGQTLKSRLPLVPLEPTPLTSNPISPAADIDGDGDGERDRNRGSDLVSVNWDPAWADRWGVTIPEPSTWSPDSPTWYELRVDEWRADQGEPTRHVRRVGLRLLAARSRAWVWGGRRWIVRGLVPPRSAASADGRIYHRETGSTWVLSAGQADLLEVATGWGIAVLGDLVGTGASWEAALADLTRYPAVAAVVAADLAQCAAVRGQAPQLLVGVPWSAAAAQPISGAPDVIRPDAWLVPEARVSDAVAQLDRCPVMIVRRSGLVGDEARVEVDRLQAAVAPAGDFAGFLALPDELATAWESA